MQVSEASHAETGQEKRDEHGGPGSIKGSQSRARRARGGERARRGTAGGNWELS